MTCLLGLAVLALPVAGAAQQSPVTQDPVADGPQTHDQAADDDSGGATEPAMVAPEGDAPEARRLFEEARRAFDAGHYPEAAAALRQSLQLHPRASSALNLARVHRSMGEPIEAERVLDGLLEEAYGQVPSDLRVEVMELKSQVRAETCVLELVARDIDQVHLRIDGTRVATLDRDRVHVERVDPGEHVVLATTEDGRTREHTIVLEPGGELRLDLRFADLEAGTVFESPWFWVAAGAIVLGGTVTAVALSAGSDPVNGDLPIARPLVAF